jgi:mannosyltransferase OCH1-like enzyme
MVEAEFRASLSAQLIRLEKRASGMYKAPYFPKIIHQSWKTAEAVPALSSDYMLSWKKFNPSYEYWFWSDDDNLHLFEHPDLAPYRSFARDLSAIQLSDMSRVAYLYLFGGIYADIDFECRASFDDLPEAEIILAPEPLIHTQLFGGSEISNAIMLSIPRHPFWLEVLDSIITWDIEKCNENPIGCTGPLQVLATLQKRQGDEWRSKKDILVLAEEYFFPEYSQEARGICNHQIVLPQDRRMSAQELAKICTHVRVFPEGRFTNNSHAVHHWACRWCGRTKDLSFDTLESILEPFSFIRPFHPSLLDFLFHY